VDAGSAVNLRRILSRNQIDTHPCEPSAAGRIRACRRARSGSLCSLFLAGILLRLAFASAES
jgi:hypothetical protein